MKKNVLGFGLIYLCYLIINFILYPDVTFKCAGCYRGRTFFPHVNAGTLDLFSKTCQQGLLLKAILALVFLLAISFLIASCAKIIIHLFSAKKTSAFTVAFLGSALMMVLLDSNFQIFNCTG